MYQKTAHSIQQLLKPTFFFTNLDFKHPNWEIYAFSKNIFFTPPTGIFFVMSPEDFQKFKIFWLTD